MAQNRSHAVMSQRVEAHDSLDHFPTPPWATRALCGIKAGSPAGGSVLDPFFGAGTTGLVADRLGRHCTGIELNPANREMGAERVRMDGPLFAEVSA